MFGFGAGILLSLSFYISYLIEKNLNACAYIEVSKYLKYLRIICYDFSKLVVLPAIDDDVGTGVDHQHEVGDQGELDTPWGGLHWSWKNVRDSRIAGGEDVSRNTSFFFPPFLLFI